MEYVLKSGTVLLERNAEKNLKGKIIKETIRENGIFRENTVNRNLPQTEAIFGKKKNRNRSFYLSKHGMSNSTVFQQKRPKVNRGT